ncbi:hypothetical protein Y600_6137 [Burkholderia pseudomallei MSHR3709]|nr:hypothetical protein Y600_6137 [Burkholderia pseudomallei MSHR3709]
MRVLFAISLLAVAWLAGCTGLRGGIERDARRDSNETGALLKRASDGDNSVRSLAPVVVDNGLWVSAGTVKLRNSEQLPPLFDEPASFDRSVASLSEFAEQITRLTQVPTQVAASAQQAAARSQHGGAGDAARGAPAFLDASGARAVPPLPRPAGGASAAAARRAAARRARARRAAAARRSRRCACCTRAARCAACSTRPARASACPGSTSRGRSASSSPIPARSRSTRFRATRR